MSYSNGLITKPVQTKDIAKALGMGSQQVGYLIENGRINKWAKYKPVRYKSTSEIGDAERKEVNQGFNLAEEQTYAVADMLALGQAGEEWGYLRPRGKDYSEQRRMLDFNGYNHKAVSLIDYHWLPTKQYTETSSINVEFSFAFMEGCEISLSDLSFFEENEAKWRFAVVYADNLDAFKNNSSCHWLFGNTIDSVGTDDMITVSGTIDNMMGTKTLYCLFVLTQNSTEDEANGAIGYNLLMPDGYFQVEVERLYPAAIVTITNLYSINPYYDASNNAIMGLSDPYPELSMVANTINPVTGNIMSVPACQYLYGYNFRIFGSSGEEENFEILESEDDGNNIISYSGKDVVTKTVINYPSNIQLSEYTSITDIVKIEITPTLSKLSGDGELYIGGTIHVWTINV